MKTSTLCVDELTLQSVVLPLHDDIVAAELPILSPRVLIKQMDLGDDGASETATVQAEDDDDATGVPQTLRMPLEPSTTATAMALSFVERMVREYALKREIHALVNKKQQQVRQMQVLITAYQDQLLKVITRLEEETQQLRVTGETLQREARKRLAEILATGEERALIEVTRTLGVLQMQRHRILRERTALRKTLVTTRQEECTWLLKSIIAQHEVECETLLSAITTEKYLEEGSLQATVAVQITQDDPIFASVEMLCETQPLARQLQLQLDSIEVVIASLKLKCEALERKNRPPTTTGPVPLVKRQTFRDRRQDGGGGGFPTADCKRVVRLCLIEGKRIRSDRTGIVDVADRHRRYTAVLRDLGRLLSDARTRSGRLLYQFVEKLHDDTVTKVRVAMAVQRDGDSECNQLEDANIKASKRSEDLMQERFLIPRLPSVVEDAWNQDSSGEAVMPEEELAVDSLKLPPPAMLAAFAKFLMRVVTTEYELLLSSSPSSVNAWSCDQREENLDDQSFEDAMDQSVLQDSIHEMVFQRITTITYASAIDEYRFTRQDEIENGLNKFLFPWHWHHSKARLQGISPTELAFPDNTTAVVTTYLKRHDQAIRSHGFLPKTLALFRTAEIETTPKGVVRAVMAGFKMLHQEISSVISADKGTSAKAEGPRQKRPHRRVSDFFNADILIPSIVLMMSRLPRPQDLDRLWHRTLLVEAFRASALSDGGEEAYYLTCLAAAMEFINTFQISSASLEPEVVNDCATCEKIRPHLKQRGVQIELLDGSPALAEHPTSTAQERPRLSRMTHAVGGWSKHEHESIKQLSNWISNQPPTDGAGSSMDVERQVSRIDTAPHADEIQQVMTSLVMAVWLDRYSPRPRRASFGQPTKSSSAASPPRDDVVDDAVATPGVLKVQKESGFRCLKYGSLGTWQSMQRTVCGGAVPMSAWQQPVCTLLTESDCSHVQWYVRFHNPNNQFGFGHVDVTAAPTATTAKQSA